MTKVIIFSFSILLLACSVTTKESNEAIATTYTEESKDSNSQPINDFSEFWKELSQASAENDTNKLLSLTTVPLEVYGREDADPRLSLKSRNAIAAAIFISLDHGGYYDEKNDRSVSNRELLREPLENLADYNSSSQDSQWINDYLFVKTKDGWKLALMYINTREYAKELINKDKE